MALVDCPECGTQISSAAPSCPKCGYPVAQEAHKALSKAADRKRELRKQTNKRDWRLLAAIALPLLVAVAIFNRCERDAVEPVATVEPGSQSKGWTRAGRGLSATPVDDAPSGPKAGEPGSRSSPKAVPVQQSQDSFLRWFDRLYTREDYTRACEKAVHGVAEYTKRFGEPGGLIQADMMLRGGDCYGYGYGYGYGYEHTDSFKCLVGTTMSIHVYDIKTFQGLRLGFLRLNPDALGGAVDSGCCAGVKKALKQYPRAKFGQWEGGCNVRFGRVPP